MRKTWNHPSCRLSVALIALAGLTWLATPARGQEKKAKQKAAAAELKVKEGDKMPDFNLPATQCEAATGKKGETVSLKDLVGKKNVVVFFYPKAMTPGCTIEVQTFRDRQKAFAEADTVVLGASVDELGDQEKFTDQQKLNFALLSDPKMELVEKLGVKRNYGALTLADRVTFVVDKQGVIRKIYRVGNIPKHPDEVLAYIKENLNK